MKFYGSNYCLDLFHTFLHGMKSVSSHGKVLHALKSATFHGMENLNLLTFQCMHREKIYTRKAKTADFQLKLYCFTKNTQFVVDD